MPVSHSLYREAGSVVIDAATCTGCGECAGICPTEVLRLEDRQVRVHPESAFGCIACGHCMMVCPKDSIRVTGRGVSPADVVALAPPEARADAESLAALLRARRSVRHFRPEEPAPELLRRVVDMAAMGPMGVPPWDVGCAVVRGRERVQALAEEIVGGYAGLLKFLKPWLLGLLRPVMKRAMYEQTRGFIVPLARGYVEGRRVGKDRLFYDAPALLLFHHSAYVDASEAMIACTHAMLAAESLGLGSTMIGAAAPILMRKREVCRRLGIPEGNRPAIALILGFPAVHFRRGIVRRFSSVTGSD